MKPEVVKADPALYVGPELASYSLENQMTHECIDAYLHNGALHMFCSCGTDVQLRSGDYPEGVSIPQQIKRFREHADAPLWELVDTWNTCSVHGLRNTPNDRIIVDCLRCDYIDDESSGYADGLAERLAPRTVPEK